MKICHSKFVDEEKHNSRKVIVTCFIIENYFKMFSPSTLNKYYQNITLYIIYIFKNYKN